MLEVVFNDSVKRSMCFAQQCKHNEILDDFTPTFFSNGETIDAGKKESVENFKKRWLDRKRNTVPLDGSPADIISLSFMLSVGDIATPLGGNPRKDLIYRWLTANPWKDSQDGHKVAETYWQNCVSDLEKLNRRARLGESVRIWYDSSPDAMCGLCSTLAQLEGINVSVSAINLPRWEDRPDSVIERISWAGVEPEHIGSFLPLSKEISIILRKALVAHWRHLQTDNLPLRAVVNGRLQSVDETFYDEIIWRASPNREFTKAALIGNVLGKYQLGVNDWLVAQRIDAMTNAGRFHIVKTDCRPYAMVLSKH
ncbi:MAG: DUF3658 domain-containing protein [Ethanoligenens sp.]